MTRSELKKCQNCSQWEIITLKHISNQPLGGRIPVDGKGAEKWQWTERRMEGEENEKERKEKESILMHAQ